MFKFDLTDPQRAALVTILGTVVPVGWKIADAVIRHGRARIAAAAIIRSSSRVDPAALPAPPT